MKKRRRKKLISFALKLCLSALLITLVFQKIDIDKIAALLKSANYDYFALALLSIFLAQIFGGLRMQYYQMASEFTLSRAYSLCMYFVGTLFNIVLPGGIGGDGYKAYYFHKRFKFPWTKTVLATLRGRSSGLFFLCFFLIAFAFFYKEHLNMIPFANELLIAALILIFPVYSICSKIFLKEPVRVQIGAMKYSFIVQLLNLFAIYFILHGIGGYGNIIGYILVFLIANIVAIIPISFGGIGLREFTYVSLSGVMGLDSGIGVAASLLFYIIYTSVALLGFIPYLNLRKLDYFELKYQRRLNLQKFCISEAELKAEEHDEEKDDDERL